MQDHVITSVPDPIRHCQEHRTEEKQKPGPAWGSISSRTSKQPGRPVWSLQYLLQKPTHGEEWSSSTSRTIMGRNSPKSTFPADFWENPGRTDSYWIVTKHSAPKVIPLNSRGHRTRQIWFITKHYPSDLTLPYEV